MATKNFKPYLAISGDVVMDVSNSFLKLTDYKKDELLGQDIFYLLNEMIRLNVKTNKLENILSNHTYIIFSKAREYREVNITQYKEGELVYLAFYEIAKSRIEDKLPPIDQQIRDNFMGVALFTADDLTLLMANDKYKNLMYNRYGQRDIVGKKIHEYASGFIGSATHKGWMQAIQSGNTFKMYEYGTTNARTGKPEYVDRSITPIKFNGEVKYLVIMVNDVTEKVLYRKQNEEQRRLIEQQKEQLETVIDQMADAIFIVDRDGKFIMTNKAAKEYITGNQEISDEDYEGISFRELDGSMIPEEKVPINLLLQGETILDRKTLIIAHGRAIYTSINATPIFDENGRFLMGILSSRDVTEYVIHNETIRKQQQLLLEAEKNEKESLEKALNMKDEFLSLISHEFKTPLTVINSALQTMELICGNELSPKAQMFLDKIKQNTYRQLRLVNNLLDITRANAGHVKVTKRNMDIIFVTKSIVESVKVYAQQKGVLIEFKTDFTHMVIALDEEKYERIILNLLSNAIKFTPENKRIIVRILQRNKRLCIDVTDEGIGIPKEKQKMIFERFGQVDNSFTRQVEGTGIGLYLVRLFVEAIGGQIRLASEVGKGSTFKIELPMNVLDDEEQMEAVKDFVDTRLIQALDIEFSDIYF